jgi:glycosyltransferase involved in cell wall biosynthesis
MACGTPVCVSNAASLPEVVGSAGLYFDPGDPENMATVIHELLSNGTLRNGLKAAGLARVKLFTKDISAKETLRIYQEALTDMG